MVNISIIDLKLNYFNCVFSPIKSFSDGISEPKWEMGGGGSVRVKYKKNEPQIHAKGKMNTWNAIQSGKNSIRCNDNGNIKMNNSLEYGRCRRSHRSIAMNITK